MSCIFVTPHVHIFGFFTNCEVRTWASQDGIGPTSPRFTLQAQLPSLFLPIATNLLSPCATAPYLRGFNGAPIALPSAVRENSLLPTSPQKERLRVAGGVGVYPRTVAEFTAPAINSVHTAFLIRLETIITDPDG
jgi:hypothetical protein